ncbi:supernatant protein factor, C-terminal domain-containing protein [Leucogyrophana mollusca]|uniref:Supernatant protein factor, C-terminal domain-containing protein n=1 Tax=Leucogyrophana mollusca TaxID=85980 RepID=A0ACB8BXZ0_9AGAM|nr:supernatant protein factor, C-terminal domain-containing protein [Leucogyrophana mollusca]
MYRTHTSWLAIICFSLLTLLPVLVSPHMIEIPASKKECFFEDLHEHDQMSVTYQVGEGGHLDIDFWVGAHALCFVPTYLSGQLTDPNDVALAKHMKQSTGSVSITAETDGRYEYCFSNQMSSIADKFVSFNVHGIIYMTDDDVVAPVEREIRSLAIGLTSVKDEQEYIVVRERRHRDTAESTNTRVKWWSVLQAIVLFSVVGWQVYYLKSFFEVKRVI